MQKSYILLPLLFLINSCVVGNKFQLVKEIPEGVMCVRDSWIQDLEDKRISVNEFLTLTQSANLKTKKGRFCRFKEDSELVINDFYQDLK